MRHLRSLGQCSDGLSEDVGGGPSMGLDLFEPVARFEVEIERVVDEVDDVTVDVSFRGKLDPFGLLIHELANAAVAEGHSRAHDYEEDDPDRPAVGHWAVIWFTFEQFRSGVSCAPAKSTALFVSADPTGESEVGDLESLSFEEKKVLALEVAMDYTDVVDVADSRAYIVEIHPRLVVLQRTFQSDVVEEITTGSAFQTHVDLVSLLKNLIHADDILVVHRLHDGALSGPELVEELLRGGGLVDDLDGHAEYLVRVGSLPFRRFYL